jgi:hypothetical protein
MKAKRTIAASTICLNAHNWLAMRAPATLAEILAGLQAAGVSLELAALKSAVAEGVARGRLLELEGGIYDVPDQQRRVLLMRTRAGDGWDGWRLGQRPDVRSVPFEAVNRRIG